MKCMVEGRGWERREVGLVCNRVGGIISDAPAAPELTRESACALKS